MTNIWSEREKALENQFIYKQEQEKIARLRHDVREHLIREMCHNRCPKCGESIEAINFRGVPMDKCPGCGGVWLGPNDLRILASKDHRSWFDLWYSEEMNRPVNEVNEQSGSR